MHHRYIHIHKITIQKYYKDCVFYLPVSLVTELPSGSCMHKISKYYLSVLKKETWIPSATLNNDSKS